MYLITIKSELKEILEKTKHLEGERLKEEVLFLLLEKLKKYNCKKYIYFDNGEMKDYTAEELANLILSWR
ncbi:MAG: hypothetical protein QXO40_00065 [Candidatus Aenigmatarchaeota archaeon]